MPCSVDEPRNRSRWMLFGLVDDVADFVACTDAGGKGEDLQPTNSVEMLFVMGRSK